MKDKNTFILQFRIESDADGKNGKIQILPAKPFRTKDNRPKNGGHFHLKNPPVFIEKAKKQSDEYLIDYEHQSIYSEMNGQPAPAAGWFSAQDLEYSENGLFASVSWTEKAEQHIKNKEYKYISPVFEFDPKTGEILRLISCGLTNTPAIDGMNSVVAAKEELPSMDESKLKTLLGLPETATSEDIFAAIEKIVSKKEPSDTPDQTTAAATQTNVADQVILQLQASMNAMTLRLQKQEVAHLIAENSSKLANANLRKYAETLSVEALKALLAALPETTALKNAQSVSTTNNNADPALTDDEKSVCKQMGLTIEDYLKYKGKA